MKTERMIAITRSMIQSSNSREEQHQLLMNLVNLLKDRVYELEKKAHAQILKNRYDNRKRARICKAV